MCQNLLAFLKDIHHFSSTSIATSSASDVFIDQKDEALVVWIFKMQECGLSITLHQLIYLK
jgi:hypothetical protein